MHIVKEKRGFMKRFRIHLIFLLIIAFYVEIGIVKIMSDSQMERLSLKTVSDMKFRDQEIGEKMLEYIIYKSNPGKEVGLYLLESNFGYEAFSKEYKDRDFEKLYKKWKHQDGWETYFQWITAIWNEVEYFPIPDSETDESLTVSFSNAWMSERTYGGKRGHEGTDIMANKNVSGIYPVLSMTDGVVTKKGWLEKGGYRIGIEASSGAYFYYAHLESYAAVNIGDQVKAGEILGYMGDTGYGPEGTTGQFPVHLHVGIYIYPGEEMSVNPYWILRYLENRTLKYAYSCGDIKKSMLY